MRNSELHNRLVIGSRVPPITFYKYYQEVKQTVEEVQRDFHRNPIYAMGKWFGLDTARFKELISLLDTMPKIEVYRLLSKKNKLSSEIIKETAMPEATVYRALKALRESNLVESKGIFMPRHKKGGPRPRIWGLVG